MCVCLFVSLFLILFIRPKDKRSKAFLGGDDKKSDVSNEKTKLLRSEVLK